MTIMCEMTDTSRAKLDKKSDLTNKARKKYIGNGLAISLATSRFAGDMSKSYWNTYHCAETIEVKDNRSRSSYCKNRWCLTCQSIKIAHLINGYKPQLSEMANPYFVTLTAPTVPEKYLPARIEDFETKWRQIAKQAQKVRKNFRGLRKAECTIRPNGHYHYHFHIIIEGESNALYLMKRWLDLNEDARGEGQDLRKADGQSMIELFKYFTKLTTKTQTKERKAMPSDNLNVIFHALKGKRVYQPFGGLKKINEDYVPEGGELVATEGVYTWLRNDWIDYTTGELLTGYEPSERDKNIFNHDKTVEV